jgi:DNA-binding response OmpR family regulator
MMREQGTGEPGTRKQGALRVLIVEDEALPAILLQGYLEDAGYEVVGWATTADEALKMFIDSQPDLVFVDLHLADGVTGMKVAQEIRRSQRPVVFITANDRMLPADYAGAIGCIGKPYSMHGIQRALEYLEEGLRNPPPRHDRPSSLTLAPQYEQHWR